MTELVKEYKYKLPYNFDVNSSEFDAFKNLPLENYYDSKIVSFKNYRVSNNSVIFRYFNIIKESCISEMVYNKYKSGYKFYLKFIFPKINFYRNKRFILITDEWTTNYYHWHLIALHRLLILKENNLIEGSILLLPKKYKKLPFILPSLEKFGIKKEQIIYLRRKSNIKVKEVFTCFLSSQNHPEAFKKIKYFLNQNNSNKTNFGERIFISRGNAILRKIVNESEVTELLKKYGFKRLLMENFSYEDQISICANAKYLISIHGAGLTNIIFMKDNSYVLEFGGKWPVNKPVTDYYKLASLTDINYLYQHCEMAGKIITDDFALSDAAIVDVKKLEDNLKLMLKHHINYTK